MTTRNEPAERLIDDLLRGNYTGHTTDWTVGGRSLRERMKDALAVERGIGVAGAMRLSLTDDHEVCNSQKREAIAAERRATVERIRGRIAAGGVHRYSLERNSVSVYDAARLDAILDEEAR